MWEKKCSSTNFSIKNDQTKPDKIGQKLFLHYKNFFLMQFLPFNLTRLDFQLCWLHDGKGSRASHTQQLHPRGEVDNKLKGREKLLKMFSWAE